MNWLIPYVEHFSSFQITLDSTWLVPHQILKSLCQLLARSRKTLTDFELSAVSSRRYSTLPRSAGGYGVTRTRRLYATSGGSVEEVSWRSNRGLRALYMPSQLLIWVVQHGMRFCFCLQPTKLNMEYNVGYLLLQYSPNESKQRPCWFSPRLSLYGAVIGEFFPWSWSLCGICNVLRHSIMHFELEDWFSSLVSRLAHRSPPPLSWPRWILHYICQTAPKSPTSASRSEVIS